MKPKTLLLISVLLASTALPSSAFASTLDFINATCGVNCPDPVLEEQADIANWAALVALGTNQFVGGTMDGVTIDASSLLAAARLVGVPELDQYLRSGVSAPGVSDAINAAMVAANGIDVSSITAGISTASSSTSSSSDPNAVTITLTSSGTTTSTNPLSTMLTNATIATALTEAATAAFNGPGLGGTSGYCDPNIANAQNLTAQNYVTNMQGFATSDQFGYSQFGGQPISAGARSQSGFFGGSCLDNLMQGTRDILFKPPQLSDLLSALGNMFGSTLANASSGLFGGPCNNAPSVLTQVQQSMPQGIFQSSGAGGFFPSLMTVMTENTLNDTAGNPLTFSNAFGMLTMPSTARLQLNSSGLSGLY